MDNVDVGVDLQMQDSSQHLSDSNAKNRLLGINSCALVVVQTLFL